MGSRQRPSNISAIRGQRRTAVWLIPIATDTESPPVGGPYKPRLPIPLASRFLSPPGDSELDIPLPTTSNPTPKFPKETSKIRAHTHTHTCTHARTLSVLPLARALQSQDARAWTRVKSGPGMLPPQPLPGPQGWGDVDRSSRTPLEKTLAPLIPPDSEAGKDQSRGEGPGDRAGDSAGKGSRDGGLGTDSSTDPWWCRGSAQPLLGPSEWAEECPAHLPSGTPFQRITSVPPAPPYSHATTGPPPILSVSDTPRDPSKPCQGRRNPGSPQASGTDVGELPMRPWVKGPFPNLGHKVFVPGTPGWRRGSQNTTIAGQGHRSLLGLHPAAPFLPTSPLRSPLLHSHAQSSPLAPSGKGRLNLAGPLSLLNRRAVTSLPHPLAHQTPYRAAMAYCLRGLTAQQDAGWAWGCSPSPPGVSIPASQADQGLLPTPPSPFPIPLSPAHFQDQKRRSPG